MRRRLYFNLPNGWNKISRGTPVQYAYGDGSSLRFSDVLTTCSEFKAHLLDGFFHCDTGPAVINHNQYYQYYINGNNICHYVRLWIEENNIPAYDKWDDEHRVLFKLRFG